MKKPKIWILAILSGLANGFFGSGGGILAVTSFHARGNEPEKAHASAVAAMLPASVVSGFVYCLWGVLPPGDILWPTILGTVTGGVLGAFLLGKVKGVWIARLFGVLVTGSAIRMVFF
ncbi:MAG: TSUP family transporter [Christensenellales bacterium]